MNSSTFGALKTVSSINNLLTAEEVASLQGVSKELYKSKNIRNIAQRRRNQQANHARRELTELRMTMRESQNTMTQLYRDYGEHRAEFQFAPNAEARQTAYDNMLHTIEAITQLREIIRDLEIHINRFQENYNRLREQNPPRGFRPYLP